MPPMIYVGPTDQGRSTRVVWAEQPEVLLLRQRDREPDDRAALGPDPDQSVARHQVLSFGRACCRAPFHVQPRHPGHVRCRPLPAWLAPPHGPAPRCAADVCAWQRRFDRSSRATWTTSAAGSDRSPGGGVIVGGIEVEEDDNGEVAGVIESGGRG